MAKKIKTILKTTASGAPLALIDRFNVKNTHVRQISFAQSDTYNESILLWKDISVLPPTPFAVGIWYQQSQELIPIGVVNKSPTSPLSVGDFYKIETRVHVPLSNILAYVVNRMANFKLPTVRYNNAEEDRIARSVMWALCEDYNRDKLKSLEEKKEVDFSVGEKPVVERDGVNIPTELNEFKSWVNGWISDS